MLGALTSFIIILIFAFSLYKLFNLNQNFTPLISITSLVSISVLLSLFNLLFLGVILSYTISIISFIFAIKSSKGNLLNDLKEFFSTPVVLFCLFSLLMLFSLSYTQPLFYEWDEFSFWGISHKLVYLNDAIYTFYDSSMIGNTTPPSLAVLAYFFHFINPEFLEWVSFFSYNVFFFSAFCAFSSLFSKKNWYLGIASFIFSFFVPYFLTVQTRILSLSTMYITTYADLPLGICFAAALAIYFLSDDSLEKRIISLIPLTIFFTFIKDMGFAFSLIVAFIIFVDLVLNKNEKTFFFIKGILGKITAVSLIAISTLASFFGWAFHMGAVLSVNRFELGGDTNIGMVDMLILGVIEFFSPEKSQKFIDMQSEMQSAIFTRSIGMLGESIDFILFILAIFIVATILSKKENRLRYIMVYIASLIGYIGYYIFHLFLYVYIFKSNAYGLPSYPRYMYPYFIGWLMLALFLLFLVIKENEKTSLLAKSFFILLTVFITSLSSYLLFPNNMFVGIHSSYYTDRDTINSKVAYLGDAVSKDDVIYVYNGRIDSGRAWFLYTFEYPENSIVQDLIYVDPSLYSQDEQEEYYKALKVAAIEYLKENNVTHLLLEHTGILSEGYLKDSFLESTYYYGLSGVAYYEIEYIGEDDIFFHFIKGEESII